MKTLITSLALAATACLVGGCASNNVSTASSSAELLSDQPQTSVAGEGSLMPGAYNTRNMPTGQFTGRERTNDQVGQRPTLPREADPRELERNEDSMASGAGTLGQSGIVPGEPVSTETLMETTAATPGLPAHVAVVPPGSVSEQQRNEAEAVGAAPGAVSERASSTNSAPSTSLPEE